MSFYSDLGLVDGAPDLAIKEAYRHLARKYHPDKGGNPTDWVRISVAYETLGNPDKKAYYDKYGSTPLFDPSTLDNLAHKELIEMFLHVVKNENGAEVNYRAAMEKLIDQREEEARAAINKNGRMITNFQRHMARLNPTDPSNDYLGDAAAYTIRQVESFSAKANEGLNLLSRMREILREDYMNAK